MRWTDLLQSNSRTATEFSWAWETLSSEAANLFAYLEKEPVGALSLGVESVGGEGVDGSVRKLVTSQLEGLRYEFLRKSLEEYQDREARPVTAFPNLADDKVAGRWLLAVPGSDMSLSDSVFKEALSAHLCLPSPSIVDGGWLGKPVGRRGAVIDKFGDSLMNCHDIFGDTWRRRHDSIKQHLVSEALLAGVHTDCKVYGMFSDLLPAVLQQEGGELQWGRARLGLVPDFKFLLNTPKGPKSFLGGLKCVNMGRN